MTSAELLLQINRINKWYADYLAEREQKAVLMTDLIRRAGGNKSTAEYVRGN